MRVSDAVTLDLNLAMFSVASFAAAREQHEAGRHQGEGARMTRAEVGWCRLHSIHGSAPGSVQPSAATRGRYTRTRVPRPGSLSTCRNPPQRSTMRCTTTMPRPVPSGFVVK